MTGECCLLVEHGLYFIHLKVSIPSQIYDKYWWSDKVADWFILLEYQQVLGCTGNKAEMDIRKHIWLLIGWKFFENDFLWDIK